MKQHASQLTGFEQIAVIGMGCRFPGGVDDPDDFWNLLATGGNGVADIPPDRWNLEDTYDADAAAPGKMYVKKGAFIDNVRGFDPYLFGITPREAVSIDPQQRLLLEISWEALENAGIAPDSLRGSDVGVFVGITNDDYATGRGIWSELESINNFTFTGVAGSVASGRIAYAFDFRGPAVQLDTACSSSLMAVHQACQSLSLGECDLALAGGVNLMLSPATTISLCKLKLLSPDGVCRAFDAGANGYVRGEGGGIVVLKRLSDAMADNDRVCAVVRGTAVNHDGSSDGIAAPNGTAQKKLLQRALATANLDREQISYVETHGTATVLGDFTEASALGEAYGGERPDSRPLYIGSVKTNIGHLEAGAGVASLMKTALMLRHGEIPPSLNFSRPNPRIPWREFGMAVPVAPVTWERLNGPRAAGVSAFGVSGTNVHLILEEAPAADMPDNGLRAARPCHLLALSANGEPALTELTKRYHRLLEDDPDVDLADLCFSANTGRAALRHRRAVVVRTVGELRGRISGPPVAVDRGGAARPAFLFSGQGCQYEGMAEELFGTSPIFRESIERCDEVLSTDLKPGLLDVLFGGPAGRALVHRTDYTQPALFALQYALARLWMSWGVTPACVAGHSIGEYAAACIAGVFGIEDGIKLAALRGRLMQALPADGRMLAVAAGEERVTALLDTTGPRISLAAVNAPARVVVSGEGEAIAEVEASFREHGIATRYLNVCGAFHSAEIEPMLARFREAAQQVRFESPRIPYVSAVTGAFAKAQVCDAGYWVEHLRKPVLFLDAMRALAAREPTDFIEIGPSSTLLDSGRRCVERRKVNDWGWLPSIGPGKSDWQVMSEGAAALYEKGAEIDWAAFGAPYSRRKVVLPTYPFQRQDYWIGETEPRVSLRRKESRDHAVAGRVARMLPGLEDEVREIAPGLDAAALRYMLRTVRQLGVHCQVGQRMSVGSVLRAVPERHHKIVDRMIGHLVGHAFLARHGDEIEVVRPVPDGDPDDMLLCMQRDRSSPEIGLLRRAGENLTEILRGESEALSVFFPGGSTEAAAKFYAEAPLFNGYNRLAARVVDEVLRNEPDGGPLRVLEIGAGTGGLSAHVLPRFPVDRTRYVFTDISPLFLNAAERRFEEHAFLETARLDISMAPEAQGFDPGSFDIVIAANVLHATPDVRRTAAHARSLLRDDGWLVLLECTSPPLWGDMVFALLAGWWLFEDRDLRPDYPLMPAQKWSRVLAEAGFSEPACLSDGGDATHTLFVARAGKSKTSAATASVSDVGDKGRAVEIEPSETGRPRSRNEESWTGHRGLLLSCAASIMEMPEDMIEPGRPLGEYGMDSLMALEFAAIVRGKTGIELPVSVISDEVSVDKACAYIAEMARPQIPGERIENERSADTGVCAAPFEPVGQSLPAGDIPNAHGLGAGADILAPLREDGGGEPVFFIPAGYGDLLAFKGVAGLLDVDRPVYGLQPPTTEAVERVRDMSIHWLVSRYIAEIKRLQPTGPYSVAGYSAGGIVAVEVARELTRTGNAVALLTIFDAPSGLAPWMGNVYAGFCRLADILRLDSLPKWTRTRRIDRCLHAITDEGLRTHCAIVRAHRILPYPGRITYFRPRRSWLPILSIEKPWRRIAEGGLEFHWLPGSHFGMFRGKCAETFAAVLGDCLRRSGRR